MYTVLLVDDEKDVLTNLVSTVDWPVYGVENVLTACNGQDACSLLAAQHIDLVITDIRMDKMDGIQLLRHIRNSYPYVRCILLSSYSDFHYAKEAISLGVENYLLKPVNPEELDDSIRKALDNISMHNHVMQSLFVDNILFRWLTNDISPEELSERSKHIDVNIYFRNYCVIVIKPTKRKSINRFLSNLYTRIRPHCDIYHFVNYDGYHVSILGGHTITQQSMRDYLEQASSDLSYVDFRATIGYVVDGFEEVYLSYQSALECWYAGQNPTQQHILCASKKLSLNLSNLQINQILEFLRSDLQAEEAPDVEQLFREVFSTSHDYSLDELNAFIDLLSVRLALSLGNTGLIDVEDRDNITSNVYHFEETPSEQKLLSWFVNIISVCQALIRKHTKNLSPTVLLAMQYIIDNHSDYVSIKDFCTHHNMNASYLGLLFKKETGIYFKDYINQIRISHAIKLLKSTNLKVVDICKRVGFTNTSYFILCFKKQTGISPARFKQLEVAKK